MSALDGMQPTRAHVVPYGPALTSTKSSVRLLTSRKAARPAVPAPTMATSTGRDSLMAYQPPTSMSLQMRSGYDVGALGTLRATIGSAKVIHPMWAPPGFRDQVTLAAGFFRVS